MISYFPVRHRPQQAGVYDVLLPKMPPPDEVQPGRTSSIPVVARTAVRAAILAYTIFSTVPPPDEVQPGRTSNIPSVASAAKRAADYSIAVLPAHFFSTPITDFPELRNGQQWPSFASATQRAGVSAYRVASQFVVQDEPQTGTTFSIPDKASGPTRAGSAAYKTSSILVVADNIPPTYAVGSNNARGRHQRLYNVVRAGDYSLNVLPSHFLDPVAADNPELRFNTRPERAYVAKTSSSAYATTSQFVVQSEPQIGTTIRVPDRAYGQQRAGAQAYQTASQFVVQSEPQLGIGLSVPDKASGAKRASDYDVSVLPAHFHDTPATEFPELRIGHDVIPSVAYAPRRASAYGIASSFVVQNEPQTGTTLFVTDKASGPQRAGVSAYAALASLPFQSEPQAGTTLSLPERGLGPKTSRQAYAIAVVPPIQSEPPTTIGISTPNKADAARRTAVQAYGIAASFVIQSEPQIGITESVADFARGSQRASAHAYFVQAFVPPAELAAILLPFPPNTPFRAAGASRASDGYRIAQMPPLAANSLGDRAADTNLKETGPRQTRLRRRGVNQYPTLT